MILESEIRNLDFRDEPNQAVAKTGEVSLGRTNANKIPMLLMKLLYLYRKFEFRNRDLDGPECGQSPS